jgi:Flp pilus assembly protein CpaB
MRVRRTPYIVVFVIAGLVAAAAFAVLQSRTSIVVARVDIAVLAEITPDMVETMSVSPPDAPPNAARSIDEVVGRYAALPILAGQDVDLRALETTPGERALGFGAPLAAGEVAFALPVEPAQAVGAALAPGARVDVLAVPNALRNASFAEGLAGGEGAIVLGRAYVVLALRTDDGQPLVNEPESGRGVSSVVVPKLGSVVVAIPSERAEAFAAAALTSTFYLTLTQQPLVEARP